MANPEMAGLPGMALAILVLAGADFAHTPDGGDKGGMIRISGGIFRPFYKTKAGGPGLQVRAFLMDSLPVTRADYLEFVRTRPEWRKTRVRSLFAENGYLGDWPGDLDTGPLNPGDPVTFVSWFAARAYCDCLGGRLPTLAEWELAAGKGNPQVSVPSRNTEGSFRLAMAPGGVAREGPRFGRMWEWISDFNSVLISGGSADETGPASSLFCGAGVRAKDPSDYAAFLRYSFRSSLKANYTLKNLGFRCARDLP